MDESRARELLVKERDEVASLLRGTEQEAETGLTTDDDSPRDYGDAALPLTQQANDEAVAADLQDRLDAIDRALARIEAGTYGRSVLSGEPIPDARLEADPAAELTVDEARAQEAEQRLPAVGDPDRDLGAGPETQLGHDVGDVPGDGRGADEKLFADVLVAASVGYEGGDLQFPGRQRAWRR
jgi:DnaK suppressor protein